MSTPSEEEEEEKTAFEIIKTWFINSPTHGIRRISRADSIAERLFWTLTFIIFTILMCIFIYTVIMKYASQPTKTSINVRSTRNPDDAPTVTFCNLNPIRNTVFQHPGKNQSSVNCTNAKCIYEQMAAAYLLENILSSRSSSIKVGYKLDDLLIRCTFNGQSCKTDFTKFFHPNYGNCYTFNRTDNMNISARNHAWSIADENSGDIDRLLLELYAYQNEYIPFLEDRTGFRIFIHRKNEIPILSQNSLFLAPRTFTRLIYSERIITFTQECRKNLTDEMKTIFNSNSIRYSQALCYKICEYRFIEEHYNCTDLFFLVFTQVFSQNRTQQMRFNRSCPHNHDYLGNSNTFDPKSKCSECLRECELIQYTVQPSYADYPNIHSEEIVYQRLDKHLKDLNYNINQSSSSACSNNRRDTLLSDVVAVEISASPYATEMLTESAMYTWVDLISSIGGQTGLWIGVSLISFVEIAELLFLLSCHFIKVIFGKIHDRWKSCGKKRQRQPITKP